MTQMRMNNLITSHVHKERTDTLDLKLFANKFTAIKTNDEGSCLESFKFSCVVSKLNIFLIMT